MKKFSVLLPALAFVLAIGTSAFTTHRVSLNAVAWEYVGPQGGEDDPNNYVLLTGQTQYECGGQATVCTIMAESDNGSTPHPVLNGQNPLTDPGFETVKRSIQ